MVKSEQSAKQRNPSSPTQRNEGGSSRLAPPRPAALGDPPARLMPAACGLRHACTIRKLAHFAPKL